MTEAFAVQFGIYIWWFLVVCGVGVLGTLVLMEVMDWWRSR